MPARRNRLFVAAQLLLALLVFWFVGRVLVRQWHDYAAHPLPTSPRWTLVLLSGAVYLATYAVLVQTWRAMLAAWNAHLRFWDAAGIWCVSSLGRYVPGKVWQIGAMGVMAEQRNVPAAAAAGTAILNTVVNIAVGIGVAMIAGWSVLQTISQGRAFAGIVLVVVIAGGIALLPLLLPPLLRVAERMLGRTFAMDRLPPRAIGYAVAGNVLAWILYGIAFQVLVGGVVGHAPGTTAQYIALYSSSYVLGYLFIVIPGGFGIRDGALAGGLTAMHLATAPEAVAIAVTSRIWLTVLEVVPGLLFLAWGSSRRRLRTPG